MKIPQSETHNSMRYFFEISYNGTAYNGWQSQNNAKGIQSVVEDCLGKIFGAETKATASGRTDAGVHCEQQFFHADVDAGIDTEHSQFRLNAILPPDIVIHSIRKVRDDAHARYDAMERTYQYRMVLKKNAFARGLAWYFFKDLDIPTMNAAAALLAGAHDFTSFSKVNTDVKNFVCDIKTAQWQREKDRLEFTITSNRFLRGMVRAVVGTLLDVGQGRTTLEEFAGIISSKDRREAGQNVPPYGLYLVSVRYPANVFEVKA
jgi:tRNA pseudouridine38-40 synthase